jgi:hypothetical protein
VFAQQYIDYDMGTMILSYAPTINGVKTPLRTYPNLVIASAPYSSFDCQPINNNNIFSQTPNNPPNVPYNCTTWFSNLNTMTQLGNDVLAYNRLTLPMATYKAGSPMSLNTTFTNFIASTIANGNGSMYQVYKTMLYTYKKKNLLTKAPLMLYSSVVLPSFTGSWGLLDYMDQVGETPTHPKFQAVIDFNQGK